MAENKTRPTNQPVHEFLASITPERRRLEGERLVRIMTEVTGVEPVMWGPSIIGFGSYHYRYDSGREGDMLRVGFSPRSARLSLYGLNEGPEQHALLDHLGPHTSSVSCVYVKRLEDVDEEVLRDLIDLGYQRGSDHATA